jgi:hypothetical protein
VAHKHNLPSPLRGATPPPPPPPPAPPVGDAMDSTMRRIRGPHVTPSDVTSDDRMES